MARKSRSGNGNPIPVRPRPLFTWGAHQGYLLEVDLRVWELPNLYGWSVKEALAADEPADFAALVEHVTYLSESSEDPSATVVEQIATIASWNLQREDLDWSNQRGAAWTAIYLGMIEHHRWHTASENVSWLMMKCDCDLFDTHFHRGWTPAILATDLRRMFVSPAERAFRARMRRTALLDRRKLDHEIASAFKQRNPESANGHSPEPPPHKRYRPRRGGH